jgi:hypothetical protein
VPTRLLVTRLVSITQELGDDPMSSMIRQIMALYRSGAPALTKLITTFPLEHYDTLTVGYRMLPMAAQDCKITTMIVVCRTCHF